MRKDYITSGELRRVGVEDGVLLTDGLRGRPLAIELGVSQGKGFHNFLALAYREKCRKK